MRGRRGGIVLALPESSNRPKHAHLNMQPGCGGHIH